MVIRYIIYHSDFFSIEHSIYITNIKKIIICCHFSSYVLHEVNDLDPAVREKPVRSPMVPPIADSWSTNLAARSCIVLNKAKFISDAVSHCHNLYLNNLKCYKVFEQKQKRIVSYACQSVSNFNTIQNYLCNPVEGRDGD